MTWRSQPQSLDARESLPRSANLGLGTLSGRMGWNPIFYGTLLAYWLLGSLIVARPAAVFGQEKEPPVTQSSTVQDDPKELAKLVRQLDSDQFEQRRHAFESLLRATDPSVISFLESAMASCSTEEGKVQLTALLSKLKGQLHERRIKEFLQDIGSDNDHGFQAWSQFRTLTSSGRLSRQLLIDLYRLHPDLLESDLSVDERQERCISTFEAIYKKRLMRQTIETADGIAIMYAMAISKEPLGATVEQCACDALIASPLYPTRFRDRSWRVNLAPLLETFYAKLENEFARGLRLGQTLDHPEAAATARNALRQPNLDTNVAFLACRFLAKHGEKKDVELLTKWMEDDRPLPFPQTDLRRPNQIPLPDQQVPSPHSPEYDRRVQDMAFAAVILLSGSDPSAYMPQFVVDDNGWISPNAIGFPANSPDDRPKSFERWRSRK